MIGIAKNVRDVRDVRDVHEKLSAQCATNIPLSS